MPDSQERHVLPPRHVAIIMDGNGRWARARGMPRTFGHQQGVEYLTLFGFSSENWSRPVEEVGELMRLLRMFLRSEVAELHRKGVQLTVIGDRDRLDKDIVDLIEHAERLTRDNRALRLTVALSYGSRQEITQAARRLAEDVAAGRIDPGAIDEQAFGRRLFTAGLPDPDLIIRTSGEKRISNFLLWQAAYAELVFLPTLWPDFDKPDFEAAIGEFQRRERRYGAVVSGA
jgi:undecaprenyl diphosphate synthase